MWIAVDIDNTITDTYAELSRKFNFSLQEFPFPVPSSFFCSKEGLKLLASIDPMPFASQVLNILNALKFDIAYLTSRPQSALFTTVRWLQKHGFPVNTVYCGVNAESKIKIITSKLQVSAVFEDDPIVAAKLVNLVPAVWLKDWPYNRKLGINSNNTWSDKRVIRFKSWKEVEHAIISINPELAEIIGSNINWGDK